jgi:SAM-dependent methyltransferase
MSAPDQIRLCETCAEKGPHASVYTVRGFEILRCQICGLGSTALPTEFDPLRIYNEGYFQGEAEDGYSDYLASEPVLRREFRRTVRRLKASNPPGTRLLEVGSAYGFFLAEARADFSCVGVEVSAPAVNYSRGRGLQVHHGPLSDEVGRDGLFDAVVMLDCIEHVDHPDDVVARIAGMTKPGGVFMITTGDWESPMARMAGRHWRLMTPPQHLFFFTPRSLQILLKRHGFIIDERGHPWKLVPFGLAAYQVMNRLGLRRKPPASLASLGFPVNLFDVMRVIARKAG